MTNESKNPDLKLGDLRYDIDDASKYNIETLRTMFDTLSAILIDIDERLKALGG